MSGRTTWYARDAAYLDRELIVELGTEHGPSGVTVMDALLEAAQQQRAEGTVRTGWRSVARKAFVTVEEAREIVQHAAEIGALDDLEVDEDGRRFRCRVSGWQADQERGRASVRRAHARTADRDTVTDDGTGAGSGPESPLPDQTRPDQEERELPSVSYQGKRVPPETIEVALGLLDTFNEATERNLGALTSAGLASPALKQIIGAVLDRPGVPENQWVQAVRNTVSNPPEWLNGGAVELGDVFGPKAADRALANRGKAAQRSGPEIPAAGMCRECSRRPRVTGSAYCGLCREELEAKLTGGPVAA